MDKYVGKRLDGRYEIQEIVGVGGMAVVYKAYDNQEDKIVAIKTNLRLLPYFLIQTLLRFLTLALAT